MRRGHDLVNRGELLRGGQPLHRPPTAPAHRPVADIGTALSNAAKRAGLEYAVCPYDIRHLWIATMLDKQVEISAIAHLADTSVCMIIKHYDEPHSSEPEKAAALLPRLGTAMGAPLRLAKPVKLA